MPRRHRVDTTVRRPVWASTVGQQTGHVHVVNLVHLRPIDQRGQASGPEDAVPLYTVVQGPHTGEVAGEQNGVSPWSAVIGELDRNGPLLRWRRRSAFRHSIGVLLFDTGSIWERSCEE